MRVFGCTPLLRGSARCSSSSPSVRLLHPAVEHHSGARSCGHRARPDGPRAGRPRAHGGLHRAVRRLRLAAARQRADHAAGASFPPWNASAGPPDGIVVLGGAAASARGFPAQRSGRARHRRGRSRPALSGGPHRLQRRQRQPVRRRPRGPCGGRADRDLRGAEGAADRRGPVAKHLRERGVFQGVGRTQAGRALAAGHLRLSHAAVDRAFRQAGFAVEAYPVDYRTGGRRPAGRSTMCPADCAAPIRRRRNGSGC